MRKNYNNVVLCSKIKKRKLNLFLILFSFFTLFEIQAQTTLINPATDGGFNSGSTFAANGWIVENEDKGAIKSVLKTVASGITTSCTSKTASAIFRLTSENSVVLHIQWVYGFYIRYNVYKLCVLETNVTLSKNATLKELSRVASFNHVFRSEIESYTKHLVSNFTFKTQELITTQALNSAIEEKVFTAPSDT